MKNCRNNSGDSLRNRISYLAPRAFPSRRGLIYPEYMFPVNIREGRLYSLTFRRGGIFAPFSDKRRCLSPRSSPRASAFASASVFSGFLIMPRDESVLLFSSRASIPSKDASRLADNNNSNHLCSCKKQGI